MLFSLMCSKMDHRQTYFFDQARAVSQRDPLVTFISMAARFGDVESLKKLLPEAIAADNCFPTSSTVGLALKRATQSGQVDVLRCLVEAGADINTKFKGASALHEAVKVNDSDVLRYLLGVHGLQCNTLSTAQKTPVMEAACRGRVQCLSMLLAKGCSSGSRNIRGLTAMHCCLLPSIGTVESEDMMACLDLLYRTGGDIDAQDRYGSTPLHIAIATENLDAVVWLLRHNCRLDIEAQPPDLAPGVFSCLEEGVALTPLLLAIHFFNRRLVQLLVTCGAHCHNLGWALPHCEPYGLLHQFLSQCLAIPRSLQSECRCVVRRTLNPNVEPKVKKLNCLPLSVQRYILMTDELQQA